MFTQLKLYSQKISICLGGGSYPNTEDKYMMMRKNNDSVYTEANNTKDNFLLYTEMNVDQVVLIKIYY